MQCAMSPALQASIDKLVQEFNTIPASRKNLLSELTRFIQKQASASQPVYLNFICTHNSRRSHIAQLWAHAAAHYYKIPNVACFSGGTEATAFNPRAVKAMQTVGFSIETEKPGENPVYDARFSDDAEPVKAFSKKYDDPFNPRKDFAAIMTCSHADENCPVVLGAAARISLTYNDPKDFDGSAQEEAKYAERVHEIGREILFAFSQIKKQEGLNG
jgi:arsenate reductase (thioredoxin)